MTEVSAKIIYAQSSDIKSRTYLEYRRDMKKKAIAELEFLPFLEKVLSNQYGDKLLKVCKHGSDADLWFSPSGKLTQEPDYQAIRGDGRTFLYEFQYAEKANLDFFDFKVSKVGRKKGGQRIPHSDREFFYALKPEKKYAFISPTWIMEKGREGPVPAWGSRPAYRVPKDVFMRKFIANNKDISRVISIIDDKNLILNFQHDFLDIEAAFFSRQLQSVVDEGKLIRIVPKSLSGFYRVCYLLDKIGKAPDNVNVWLVYLLSLYQDNLSAKEFACFLFSLDFLYFKCEALQENEKNALAVVIERLQNFVGEWANDDGSFAKNPNVPPIEETRQILFAVNLLEDLRQNMAVLGQADINRIKRIFEAVPDVAKTADYIRTACQKH